MIFSWHYFYRFVRQSSGLSIIGYLTFTAHCFSLSCPASFQAVVIGDISPHIASPKHICKIPALTKPQTAGNAGMAAYFLRMNGIIFPIIWELRTTWAMHHHATSLPTIYFARCARVSLMVSIAMPDILVMIRCSLWDQEYLPSLPLIAGNYVMRWMPFLFGFRREIYFTALVNSIRPSASNAHWWWADIISFRRVER